MLRKSSFRQTLVIILSLCLMLSSYSIVFGAEKGSDIKGHWAEAQINSWVDKGLITGYDDGSFKPDKTITRGEFMSLVNRSFGLSETADINFVDLKSSVWVYADVQKAVKAGYIKGYNDQTIRVSNTISRQEAAVVIASLLRLTGYESTVGSFSDASTIASWSIGAVGAVAYKGIVSGYEDNSFKPTKAITRAEAVVMLDKAIQAREVTYSAAGTYGPATGTNTISGNVSITAGGVTLQNTTINGDMLLADSIGNGDVFLNNVNVKGTMTIKGGGANSVHLNNSVMVNIIVNKATGDIRIVAEGSTTIKTVTLQSGAKLESQTTDSGTGFGAVTVTNLLPKDSVVTLLGSFDSVDVASSSIKIEVPEGSIKQLSTTTGSEGVSLNLGKDVKVVDLVLDAVLKVLGKGTIENATVSEKAKDSTFEKQPTKVEGNGAPATPPSTQPSTPPSSGGGGSVYVPPVVTPPVVTPPVVTPPVDPAIATVASPETLAVALLDETVTTIKFGADIILADNYLQINRQVTIDGQNHSLNKGIAVEASHVILKNINLAPSFFYTIDSFNWYYGVMVGDVTGVQISHLNITGDGHDSIGISDKTGSLTTGFTVDHTTVTNGWLGIIVDSSNTHATISNNTISNEKHAISLENATFTNLSITGNMISAPKLLGDGVTSGDGITLPLGSSEIGRSTTESANAFADSVATSKRAVFAPDPLLSSPTLTIYAPNVGIAWGDYPENTVFQANVNLVGVTSLNFSLIEISLYHDTTLLATNTAKASLIGSGVAGITDLFGIGDAQNTETDPTSPNYDPNWIIGAYPSSQAPTRAVFKLVGADGITVHTVEAIFTP